MSSASTLTFKNPIPAPQQGGNLPFSTAFLTALLGLLAIALYLPSIGFEFVYDSEAQVLIDPFLHDRAHFWDLLTFRVLGLDILDFNRPMVLLSLMIDALLWGRDTPGYHLTNVLLHGGCVMLLFRWLLTLTARPLPAFLATLLYAVHPLLTETVVEVGFREDLLAAVFILAGLCAATHLRPGRAILPGIVTVGCLFLAVAAKESGVAGVAILTVYWWLYPRQTAPWKPWLATLGTLILLTLAFLIARFALEPSPSLIFTSKPSYIASSLGEFLITQSRIWTGELLRIVWPLHLCADYNGFSIKEIGSIAGPIAVASVLAIQAYLSYHSRLFALATVVFWTSLLPASNILPMYKPMADRFLYLPLLGVALMLTIGFAALWPAAPSWQQFFNPVQTATPVAILLIVGACALLTRTQQSYWATRLSLWEQTSKENPFSDPAQSGVAYALCDQHCFEEALEPFAKAIQLTHRSYAGAYAGYAIALSKLGRYQEASRALGVAISLDSRYSEPDRLEPALVFYPSQIATLKVILLRSKTL